MFVLRLQVQGVWPIGHRRAVDLLEPGPGKSEAAVGPQVGQVVCTQSVAAASGETPFGFRSAPRSSGSRTGSWSSGTGTSPCSGQCTTGIGAPQ